MRLVVDTDAGCDDLLALTIALTQPRVEIVAITTVFGNVSLSQANENIGKLLRIFDRTDISFYSGAHEPLLTPDHRKDRTVECWAGHGKDGMGDGDFNELFAASSSLSSAPRNSDNNNDTSFPTPHPSLSAALFLANIVHESARNTIHVVALGPLTNIALAMKIYPNFVHNIASLTIMGASMSGKGNSSMAAEFNFHCDPESAYVVFSEFSNYNLLLKRQASLVASNFASSCSAVSSSLSSSKLITVATWDFCLDHALTWAQFDELTQVTSTTAKFIREISRAYERLIRSDVAAAVSKFIPCDAYAMAVWLDPNLVTAFIDVHCVVETEGRFSAGHLVIDHYKRHSDVANARIVKSMDMSRFAELLQYTTCSLKNETISWTAEEGKFDESESQPMKRKLDSIS